MCVCVCVCVCVCESKYGFKSDNMKKAEKQNNPNRWIYCYVKSTLNISVSTTIIRTLISGKLFTQRLMLVEITGSNKMYSTKRYKRAHSVLNLKVLSTCLARGKIFENFGYFFFLSFFFFFFSRDEKKKIYMYIQEREREREGERKKSNETNKNISFVLCMFLLFSTSFDS